ncbi:D-alanyl-D-alanine carboxypeptidase family protein [Kumtagia ephedrae]|uniref:D-alanyl-D-alanine carboxypeptidase n=1 Tax=Kumtagia ephedrae TaxID=2116701 RepID=A0A2P7RSK3_9HYPH|nr:D-alanyl-D-alanine carboxypeptidase family protein [Mesorhizobium ephedrae]PSJ53173.1 D-alanyl-D-alanine carboxypeptidase [Mesorhizobium ephedrae]
MIRRTLLIPALLAGMAASTALHVAPAAANPSILFDPATGRVIESDDAFHRWYPASLTKLMTTYVVFRAIQSGELTFSSPVRISKKASELPPSKMGYKPGSVLTVDNALKIIMVKSANDVAMSLGESVAGSQAAFAEMMNAESRRLGMTDSHWINPHGLHDDGQYTSPRDLALLSVALRRDFPQYSDYFSIEGLLADGKEVPSHNNLLGRYDGADGMKTGYTCPSGFNLVASASRNGRTLMAIVVGGESVEARDEKAADLLSRGFAAAPGSGPSLAELRPASAARNLPVNMYDQLCSKEVRAARAKKDKELREAIKAGRAVRTVPIYSAELPRPRRLVSVRLGGAQGPVPKAVAEAQAYADVPIPTWRPDMPVPGLRTAEQGDGATIR